MAGEWREITIGEFARSPTAKDYPSKSAIRSVMSLCSAQTGS
jgi:hypothetical protein